MTCEHIKPEEPTFEETESRDTREDWKAKTLAWATFNSTHGHEFRLCGCGKCSACADCVFPKRDRMHKDVNRDACFVKAV